MEINEAYEDCRRVIERQSKTFAKAFQHLPKRKRQAVWAVYAFCRRADDLADEGDSRIEDLNYFKDQFTKFTKGEIPEPTSQWIALKDTFESFQFDIAPFYDMLKGQEMDLKRRSYKTFDDVLDYSYHVASTVGLMLLPILAPGKEEKLKESAIYLGYAMQLTNILRDIGEDLNRNRVYLPKDLMTHHQYSETMLFDKQITAPFILLWEEIAAHAETFYLKGLMDMGEYPLNARIPVRAAAYFYKEILNSVRANNYDVFRKRAYVSREEKQQILRQLVDA